MGEAKRRREALAMGQPLAEDLHRCPRCLSRRTMVSEGPPMGLSRIPTLYGVCGDCKALWEAYPPGWKHDVCEGEPCDNCAFRPGAPEHEDRSEWRSLLAKLRMGQEFRCHKGAPIHIDHEAGTVEFDAEWVNNHGRTCAGFHRAIMTRGDWLEHRVSVGHVLTTHDQDKLMGAGDEAAHEEGRTPTDGRPFYCANCGVGYDEWLACDVLECGPLETVEDAEHRAEAIIETGEG